MHNFLESSFKELYSSTINSFPRTTKRQYSIDSIRIVKLHWIPYLGLKTLYIKGLAQNIDNSREYFPIILFRNVNYSVGKNLNSIEIEDNNGKRHRVEKINNNDILVRCNCKDFFWRGNYADYLDGSLYGRKRSKYYPISNRGSVNPRNDPMICKHIIKMYKVLSQSGIIK